MIRFNKLPKDNENINEIYERAFKTDQSFMIKTKFFWSC